MGECCIGENGRLLWESHGAHSRNILCEPNAHNLALNTQAQTLTTVR
jgi:hypothetical protein